jgi:hypothetical protein
MYMAVPIFVPSHRAPGPAARWSYPLVTYVTDGIEGARLRRRPPRGTGTCMCKAGMSHGR